MKWDQFKKVGMVFSQPCEPKFQVSKLYASKMVINLLFVIQPLEHVFRVHQTRFINIVHQLLI